MLAPSQSRTPQLSSIRRDTSYRPLELLGSGAAGTVVLCSRKESPNGPESVRAVKVFSASAADSFQRERAFLKKLRGCSSIIQAEGSIATPSQCYLILPECDGALSQLVSNSRRVSEEDGKLIFVQMVRGLLEAHQKGVCHHDVKLENYLIKDKKILLSDFGCSVLFDDEEWADPAANSQAIKGQYSLGSPAYSSLQVLLKQSHSGVLNDIYGLGVCLFRLLSGRYPFCRQGKDSRTSLVRKIAASKDQSKIRFPSHLSRDARDLICGMIAVEEADRFGWEQILSHPWCKSTFVQKP